MWVKVTISVLTLLELQILKLTFLCIKFWGSLTLSSQIQKIYIFLTRKGEEINFVDVPLWWNRRYFSAADSRASRRLSVCRSSRREARGAVTGRASRPCLCNTESATAVHLTLRDTCHKDTRRTATNWKHGGEAPGIYFCRSTYLRNGESEMPEAWVAAGMPKTASANMAYVFDYFTSWFASTAWSLPGSPFQRWGGEKGSVLGVVRKRKFPYELWFKPFETWSP